jgi:uncharacterized OsmC-like protein
VATNPKRFEYAIGVDRAGQLSAEGGAPVLLDEGWSPDHVLLASVARCTINSLRHHAEDAGMDLVAEAEASGVVTKRDEDDRYAFVEIDCRIDVELEPAPSSDEELRELLAKAERHCFVSASLRVEPRYRWRVNGRDVDS